MKKNFCFSALMSLLWAANAHASLVSTFDSSNENWRSANDVTLSWKDTGGNPGGYLQGKDWGDGRYWYFVSRASWAGDWSQYKDRMLSFDLKIIDTAGGDTFNTDTLRIYGNNGNTLRWTENDPNSSWTHYDVLLNPTNFSVKDDYFLGVISNVKEIWIRGEYSDAAHDIEGLDNVHVVPLPDTILIFSSGMAGLAGIRKRSKKIS
jgi:hypothetical protein